MAETGHGNSGMHEHLEGVRNSRQLSKHGALDNTLFIDGTDAILGRMASYAAKSAINGKSVIVLNCNKLIITGQKNVVINDFKDTMKDVRGRHKGPFYQKTPEGFVRKAISGMLPRTVRGRNLLKKIEVYRDIPKEYAGNKTECPETLKRSAGVTRFVTVEELTKQMKSMG